MLAQHRGDYGEAEARYRQALEIRERLGDPTSAARSWSQLGVLAVEQGSPADAVAWHIQALAVHQRLQLPDASIDLERLASLRRSLGLKRFSQILRTTLYEDIEPNINQLLDEFERGFEARPGHPDS